MGKSIWKNRRVLITGANGFLASWIVKQLLDKQADIVALVYDKVTFSLFDLDGLDKCTHTFYGDILDFRSMKRLIKEFRIQSIFHVGAQAINKTAVEAPMETLDTNVRGTYHLLEAVRTISPHTQIIVASSDKAYGIHHRMPYKETYPLHGEYPYEVSKSCADLISLAYYKTYGLPVCVVRSGNIYGGGDWHFSRIVPNTILSAYQDINPPLISNAKRDYIYASDIANGYIKLAEKMANGLKGEAFNFGTNHPISSSQLITEILKIMGKKHLHPQKSKEKRMEIPVQYLSTAKARKLLGFSTPTSLSAGLQETVKWYISHMKKIIKTQTRD
jgi:CDP-glucose 4,6-dehydratase